MSSENQQPPGCLPKLLKAALGKNARDCIRDMLEVTIRSLDASGAVLWQATEGAEPKASTPTGYLFMLATAFPGIGSFGIHNLDFEETIAGKTVRDWMPSIVNDIRKDGGRYKDHPFLRRHDLNKTIALPFKFRDGTLGAVTVYRTADSADFKKADTTVLKKIFQFIPELLAAAQTRARQELLEKAGDIFKAEDSASDQSATSARAWKASMQRLGNLIANLFHTAETSIILSSVDKPDVFKAIAIHSTPTHKKRIRLETWRVNTNAVSFTEACLTVKRSIRLFDMRQPQAEVGDLKKNGLPGFRWSMENNLDKDAAEALGVSFESDSSLESTPLSFLCVPVKAGKRIHGVIRCWIATPPISYFSRQDQHLLELVADQLGRQCELRMRNASFATEVSAWRKISLVLNSRGQYRSPQNRPMGRTESLDEFTLGCFNLLDEIAKTADLNALWLLDESGKDLVCSLVPWIQDSHGANAQDITKWSEYMNQRLPLLGDSPAAQACRNGKEIRLPSLPSLNQLPMRLPGLARQHVFPINTPDKKFGALELGSSSSEPFPDHAVYAARLIAAFLSHHLATRTALSGQQKAEHRRLEAETLTNDAFRDIMHQMKGPLVEAARRIDEVAQAFDPESDLRFAADKAARLVKRSFRTARRVGIFGQLARSGFIVASHQTLEAKQIIEVLEDAWESARVRSHPRMRLWFTADFDGIKKSIPHKSVMDAELLMHAVHNVLDNAIKYSYSQQEVRLNGGSLAEGGWYLHVWNKGIPLKPQEVRMAKQRSWRSPIAQFTTGEGSGIGLWIVDRIMQSLGGQLHMSPTRPDGWTQVRLQFNPVPLPIEDAKYSQR